MNLLARQRTADRQIKRFGAKGFLVRGGVKRPCWIGRSEYKPVERELYEVGSERFSMSALALPIGPDNELDVIEWQGSTYRINPPVKKISTDGKIIVMWDLNVTDLRVAP